jgi:hypothetical protein
MSDTRVLTKAEFEFAVLYVEQIELRHKINIYEKKLSGIQLLFRGKLLQEQIRLLDRSITISNILNGMRIGIGDKRYHTITYEFRWYRNIRGCHTEEQLDRQITVDIEIAKLALQSRGEL